MHNIPNIVRFFTIQSFYYLPTPISFCTYLPLTPSISDISTPPSNNSSSPTPTLLFSSNLDQTYCQMSDQPFQVELPADERAHTDANMKLKQQEDPNNNLTIPNFATSRTFKQEELSNPKVQEQSRIYIRTTSSRRSDLKKQGKKMKSGPPPDIDYIPERQKPKKPVSKYQIN